MLSAAVMPMNSVIMVSQSTSTRSNRENHPQKDAEGMKDRLRMAPLGHRAEPYGHFLHVIGDRPQQDQKPDQMETDTLRRWRYKW